MIDLVSESLRTLLEEEMTSPAAVTLLSPADSSTAQRRVNLFLYLAQPNPQLRNRDWIPSRTDPTQLAPPPLALTLHYLLTAYALPDELTGQTGAHALLGDAMRVLHEHAIVPQSRLENGLREGEVKVTLQLGDAETLTKLWTSFSEPFRLSALYEVSFAEIPSDVRRPVPSRVRDTALTVTAAGGSPVVTGFAPRSGAAGDELEVTGKQLAGWTATVRIGGVRTGDDAPLRHDERFSVTVPATLVPGTYEVEVDVGGLADFRAGFEVTP